MLRPELDQIIGFLLDAPMFCDLDATGLSQIVHILEVQTFAPGLHIFREGEPGDAWYVLYDGQVEVLKAIGGGQRVVATLGPRACFGEMAILDGSPRSASVRTLQDTVAFRFPRMGFNELLRAGNLAAYKLVHQMALVLVARQRQTTARLVHLLGAEDAAVMRGGIEPIVDTSSVAE